MLKRLMKKKFIAAGLVVVCGVTGFALPPEGVEALAAGIAIALELL